MQEENHNIKLKCKIAINSTRLAVKTGGIFKANISLCVIKITLSASRSRMNLKRLTRTSRDKEISIKKLIKKHMPESKRPLLMVGRSLAIIVRSS